MPKYNGGQAYVLSKDEIKRMLKVVSTERYAKRDTLLIYLSYGLGLRVLELAHLKLYHVFNPDESINEVIILTRTKSNIKRTVYLPNDKRLYTALREYLIERKEHAIKKRIPFNLLQPLFLSQKGISFSNKSLQKRFERLYKISGIHGASSHSGRRTFATNLIEQGVDIKALSTLMGHTTVAMTARYVENNPERLKKIASLSLNFF